VSRAKARVAITGVSCAAILGIATACDRETGASRATQEGVGTAGRILYLTHCEGCHGVAGDGRGPAAASLRIPPADLTRLWERYGAPLDRERLAQYIDGRMLASFHGPREMPIWGDEFFEDAPPGAPSVEASKRRLIDVLIEYLETLQTRQHT
jgi:mono/diheme cytochrome c family protein